MLEFSWNNQPESSAQDVSLTTLAYRYARGLGMSREQAINSTNSVRMDECISEGEIQPYHTRISALKKGVRSKAAAVSAAKADIAKTTAKPQAPSSLKPNAKAKAKQPQQTSEQVPSPQLNRAPGKHGRNKGKEPAVESQQSPEPVRFSFVPRCSHVQAPPSDESEFEESNDEDEEPVTPVQARGIVN